MTKIQVPQKFSPLFDKNDPYYGARYLTWYGGRGGMKSWVVARSLLLRGLEEPKIILCTREYQNSIRDSVMGLLKQQAEMMEIERFYDFQRDAIYGSNGTSFIFKGLHHNVKSIKSTEGVDICWNEEGQDTSEDSWKILVPTIRKKGSQIITTFNTGQETDPTYQRLIKNAAPGSYACLVNYTDNPWCDIEFIKEAERMRELDPEAYAHIYLGEPWALTDAQVLRGKYRISDFELPQDCQTYYGVDWGFSVDPTVIVKVHVKDRTLFIEKEAYGAGVEITEYKNLFNSIGNLNGLTIRADNARPEIINHMKKEGFGITAADKWPGSVEDGIGFLRSFDEIVIHPCCVHTTQEARLWSYKTDKLTGDVLPILIDKHNHCWDAVRYAIQPLVKKKPRGFFS